MASFTATITALAASLSEDTALQAYCLAEFGRNMTVQAVFRNKAEIGMDEMPVALITRPRVKKNIYIQAKDQVNSVFVYLVFFKEDANAAALNMIRLEELVDDALTKDGTQGGACTETTPVEAVNDEGRNHPLYAILAEYSVDQRRFP